MILIAYRHAQRVSELVSLRWDAIDLVGFHPYQSTQEWPRRHASIVGSLDSRSTASERLSISAHPLLRHGCGFRLANKGIDARSIQAYTGHSSIATTAIYTETVAERFKGFWKD